MVGRCECGARLPKPKTNPHKWCSSCLLRRRRASARRYAQRKRQENPEACRAAQRSWCAKNRERSRAHSRRWRLANLDQVRERQRSAYHAQQAKMRERQRRWRNDNREAYLKSLERTKQKRDTERRMSKVRFRIKRNLKRFPEGLCREIAAALYLFRRRAGYGRPSKDPVEIARMAERTIKSILCSDSLSV